MCQLIKSIMFLTKIIIKRQTYIFVLEYNFTDITLSQMLDRD